MTLLTTPETGSALPTGFELPGRPEGLEQLGGIDFDDRVFDHVRAALGSALDALDPEQLDHLDTTLQTLLDHVQKKAEHTK